MESGIVVNELASRTESREWELTSEKDDIGVSLRKLSPAAK